MSNIKEKDNGLNHNKKYIKFNLKFFLLIKIDLLSLFYFSYQV